MKQIQELIKATQVLRVEGNSDTRVSRLAYDSRRIAPGDCFFAVSGTQSDGHAYIDAAVTAGAAAVVCQRLPEHLAPSVCYVVVADTNAAMADMAAAFYGDPSRQLKLVGITGTNGKTTTVTLLYDLFRGLGYKVGLISTVVYRIDTERIESTHTTPDAIRLNEMMARMVEAGCEYCFMEVSSHAIVQERIRGLHFTGGIFSNITHDHLDYHKTFAEYIRAKKLFFDNLPKEAFALINIDDRNGRVMVQNTRATVKPSRCNRWPTSDARSSKHTPTVWNCASTDVKYGSISSAASMLTTCSASMPQPCCWAPTAKRCSKS